MVVVLFNGGECVRTTTLEKEERQRFGKSIIYIYIYIYSIFVDKILHIVIVCWEGGMIYGHCFI